MRKRIGSLIAVAALAVVAMIGGASQASAASNGYHDQEFTCTTFDTSTGAGTTFTSVVSYHVSGVGTSASNRLAVDQWAFHTTPAAQLDRLFLRIGDNTSGGSMYILKSFGDDNTQNDVSSSYTSTSFPLNPGTWPNGSIPYLNVYVEGGQSNGSGWCSRQRNVL